MTPDISKFDSQNAKRGPAVFTETRFLTQN